MAKVIDTAYTHAHARAWCDVFSPNFPNSSKNITPHIERLERECAFIGVFGMVGMVGMVVVLVLT